MFRRGAPCEVCHLWACKCEHPQIPTIEAAECQTPEPQTIEDFTTKTHADLARLSNECKQVRRYIGHIPCADTGACVHCAKVKRLHAQINDHLDQLETAALEAAYGDAS